MLAQTLTLCAALGVATSWDAWAEPEARSQAQSLPSIQAYTGIWDMPTARVLPDWSMRLHVGDVDPYRYYGGAVGFWDRFELHGQFTEVSTVLGFPDDRNPGDYGDYKDRSAGGRVVLVREGELFPQIALGAYDATGTAVFGQRYLVMSKLLGSFDLTLGLGQGILAGDDLRGESPDQGGQDSGFDFLLSSPWRATEPFGGVEWRATDSLTVSAEYSPIRYDQLFGGPDKADSQVNLGLKYRLSESVLAQAAWMRGRELAWSLSAQFPLEPEGLVAWKDEAPYRAYEEKRQQAYLASDEELATMLASELKDDGFGQAAASVAGASVWMEAANTRYLSDAKALGRMARIVDEVAPWRIRTVYLNLIDNGQVVQSLKASRRDLADYLQSRQDKTNFLAFSELDLYGSGHWEEFARGATDREPEVVRAREDRLSLTVLPRVRTYWNNRSGFLTNKAVLQTRARYRTWHNGSLWGEFEHTLHNEYDRLRLKDIESDEAVNTDRARFEARSGPRLTGLAFTQYAELPKNVMARASAGIFDTTFAGVGAEVFRLFDGGLWGLGLETAWVRKRDIEDNFALADSDIVYNNTFLNVYVQPWPSQGIEAGLMIGRFLAGDEGVRMEVRRAFKYFTLGVWYTVTDTDVFASSENRGAREKGVFIRIPFSIFRDSDRPGHFRYAITSFTKDQGAVARQPGTLFPLSPYDAPANTVRRLDDMRTP